MTAERTGFSYKMKEDTFWSKVIVVGGFSSLMDLSHLIAHATKEKSVSTTGHPWISSGK